MNTFPSRPVAPNDRWPAERRLRWIIVVGGWAVLYSVRAPIGPFLLLGVIGAGSGFYLANHAAVRRRQWLAYWKTEERWRHGYVPQSELRRWMWRLACVGAAFAAGSIVAPWLPIELAMWWSAGWLLAEYTDRATAAGTAEWDQWKVDLSIWQAEFRAAWESECSWASAFPDYASYVDAWDDREVGPLREIQFDAAKQGRSSEAAAAAAAI